MLVVLALHQSKRQRANARNSSLEPVYRSQVKESTQSIKTHYLVVSD